MNTHAYKVVVETITPTADAKGLLRAGTEYTKAVYRYGLLDVGGTGTIVFEVTRTHAQQIVCFAWCLCCSAAVRPPARLPARPPLLQGREGPLCQFGADPSETDAIQRVYGLRRVHESDGSHTLHAGG